MTDKIYEQEKQTVLRFMPRNTLYKKTSKGVGGWVYTIKSELLEKFKFFAYFDGAYYQVFVITPQLENHWRSPHTGHLYGDGRICFGHKYRSGMPTLRQAYAKSVLWANGISVALRTNKFPFSANNN